MKELTDAQINDIFALFYDRHDDHMDTLGFARAILAAAPATPAPQAARSDVLEALCSAAADLRATYKAISMHGGPVVSVGQFGRLSSIERILAAAPAVAITRAATSEPVARVIETDEGESVINAALPPGTLVYADWIPLTPESKRGLAGCEGLSGYGADEGTGGVVSLHYKTQADADKAYQFFAAAHEAAPVAHLAGTTPNTEAPSVKTRLPKLPRALYEEYPAMSAQAHEAEVKEYVRAALSAQQAGVQEVTSEDAKDAALHAFIDFAKIRREEIGCLSDEMEDVVEKARAALAARGDARKGGDDV